MCVSFERGRVSGGCRRRGLEGVGFSSVVWVENIVGREGRRGVEGGFWRVYIL